MSFEIQELIHRIESGAGARVLKALFVLIIVMATAALYDTTCFKNLSNREAMDMAQVGKNLTDGKGYTTLLVRPFSMFLLQSHRPDRSPQLKTDHPDVTNPPAYPFLLSQVFKLIPAKYFAASEKDFTIYVPDLVIALCNQALLLVAALLLFVLANRVFDSTVAWVASIAFVGSEVIWRFSISGLSTMLLIVVLLATCWCLHLAEHWDRLARKEALIVCASALAGALVGLGGLVRYSFAWLMIPVLIYLIAFFRQKRAALCLAALAGFLVVLSPWVYRNYAVCGLPFGTATLSVIEGTPSFQDDLLQRSLHPDLRRVNVKDLTRKLAENSRHVVQDDLPKLGGSWVAAFFLVGLLVPFRSSGPSRLRWLLIFSLAVFCVVQALGRTVLSTESPVVNSENMLVVLSPLVFLFGAAFFFLLLDSISLPFLAARIALTAGFCAVAALPLMQSLLPPYPNPIAYPPYYPPLIQRVASWFNPDELLMSDIPGGVAWYGRRQCVTVTLNWKKDFIEITDLQKPIKGLYLTPNTTDTPFLSNWVRGGNRNWADFLLQTMVNREVPDGFPLRRAPEGFFPEQLLLTDYDRWSLRPK